MKNDKIEQLLNKKAKSPTPGLTPDPFLATRIAAIADGKKQEKAGGALVSNWSFASVITAFAVVLGVYFGSAILDSEVQNTDDVFSEYSQAFYQTGFAENFETTLDSGGSEE
ncbi:MAG: hypothetical protein D8M58_18605 [Calditrichaeota bacterium]|nr:MAG: hypothetical protein DWQ03_11835 [Calditrichota bacterium]MBL1207421.1 hypothetical protein [Calditrichota bacterium]NOG47253.1 hypothetical protein [Calditrichota bacterium]